jgi:nucleoside transporter
MTRTPRPTKVRLCVMMFLQYFVQGSYLSIVSVYLRDALHFSDDQIGNFLAALAVGPILAPLVVGQLVDRVTSTERVLAACHFLAGLCMLGLYAQTDYGVVLGLGTLYSVLYVPTMMLTNTLAFRHLADRDAEFPLVRVWGTIGFIVPAWLIEFYFLNGLSGEALNRARGIAFAVSGCGSLLMAAYCLTLPHTPPSNEKKRDFAPAAVFRLLRRLDFLVLTLVTFVIAGAHNFYFVWNGPLVKNILVRLNAADKVQSFTTISQIAEIVVMAVVAISVRRLGFKGTMLIGLAAYSLRCVALALAGTPELNPYAALALAGFGNALHGVCFGFFLAVAFMYVDKTAPADVKGSMQTIYGTCIFGIGAVLGANLGGRLGNVFLVSDVDGVKTYEWYGIWLSCAAAAGLCFLAFALFFPRRPSADEPSANAD